MAEVLSGYTIFVTYLLVPDTLSNLIDQEENENGIIIPYAPGVNLGAGNSKYIHCNYINKLVLDTDNPYNQEIVISFPYINDFKFLSDDINSGSGYTANKIYAIIQLVDNSMYDDLFDVIPDSSKWKKYNITNQIKSHVVGDYLTPSKLTGQVFKVQLTNYDGFPVYNIHDYITFPNETSSSDNDLCFGDEQFFFGNVSTDIRAIAYTTDIIINLGLNEFNSSTNLSWKDGDQVIISEIGIYDDEYNLVAIGKLNNPIPKDSNISRTIVFDFDF